MERILECVPNFSEGRDLAVIKQIADAIALTEGVKLLNVDSGYATNRTVITFAGNPEQVFEAAFQAIRLASELIDMRTQKGEHPRFGATDVCPLIPISGITLDETIEMARKLAKRVGEELGIHVYCYEFAAFSESRKSLANCRSGEYESLSKKIIQPEWKPDFGPTIFNAKSGAIAIGARNFLIAYNINLNTPLVAIAKAIAAAVRESGKIVLDESGRKKRIVGTLKKVRAIGWYIEEYKFAQVSLNLIDMETTPLHIAFDEIFKQAELHGVKVIGSELIGLIPLDAMLNAGKYFLQKESLSTNIPEKEIIIKAATTFGLGQLTPFEPEKRIIEYLLRS